LEICERCRLWQQNSPAAPKILLLFGEKSLKHCESSSFCSAERGKSWSFRLRVFVFNVVGNKPLPKLRKCAIIYRVSDLLCQVQVKIEIVHCNEAKAEYLLRFNQVTNVTARKSPTCRASTLFYDWTLV